MNPLISQNCLQLINKYINLNDNLIEIGSGGSTPYFCSKYSFVCSLESDSNWYNKVNTFLVKNNISNIDYRLIPPKYPNNPNKWSNENYFNYLNEIRNFNKKFNIAFIDGMARALCYLYVYVVLEDNAIIMIHDFYNTGIEEWCINILFKYYDEVESIKECWGHSPNIERGNDIIILKKKNVFFDPNDIKILDEAIKHLT